MEKSFDEWNKSTIPQGIVDGMGPEDLQVLTGFTVVDEGSRGCMSRPLLGASPEKCASSPSISTSSTLPKTKSKITSNSSRSSEPSRDKPAKKISSWKRFSRFMHVG